MHAYSYIVTALHAFIQLSLSMLCIFLTVFLEYLIYGYSYIASYQDSTKGGYISALCTVCGAYS